MVPALRKTELYSNSSSKVKRGDDERTSQTVRPPQGDFLRGEWYGKARVRISTKCH